MPDSRKQFAVQVGHRPSGCEDDAEYLAENAQWTLGSEYDPATHLLWDRQGTLTDSFPQAEANAILAAKTYRNVRVVSIVTEVIEHVGV